MECKGDEGIILEPVVNSSVLSLSILCVFEFEIPIHDLNTLSILEHVVVLTIPRFSCIMVEDERTGIKNWKKVDVNVKEHNFVPILPDGMSLEFYDKYFENYLSELGTSPILPQNRPLWEVHVFQYPTSNAAGTIIIQIHHSIGDGYSLIGGVLSCFKRSDNPSLPLTLPTGQSTKPLKAAGNNIFSLFKRVPRVSSWVANTLLGFASGLLRSTVIKDVESPIRSGCKGVEFQPMAMTTMEYSLDQIKNIKNKLNVVMLLANLFL